MARRDARDFQANAVEACAGGQVERLEVFVAESQVRRDFGREDFTPQFAVWSEDPYPFRTGRVEIALDIHLHPVSETFFAGRFQIGEDAPILYRPVRLDVIDTHDIVVRVGVGDIE